MSKTENTAPQSKVSAWMHRQDDGSIVATGIPRVAEIWREQGCTVLPLYEHPPQEQMTGVYGPYVVTLIGAGVWAAITDELPPELVDKKVWVTTTLPPQEHLMPPADEIDAMIERLLDAQQDVNFAANCTMDQSLCDVAAFMDNLESLLLRCKTSPPPPQTRARG